MSTPYAKILLAGCVFPSEPETVSPRRMVPGFRLRRKAELSDKIKKNALDSGSKGSTGST